MTAHDELRSTLDALTPRIDRPGDWQAVVQSAERRRGRRSRISRAAAVAVVVLGVAVFALAWPLADERPGGVLDRALAAVGDGPVLHVVLRGEWGGSLVDLQSGGRTPVHGERELWYDAERGRVHEVTLFGGAVEHESVWSVGEPERQVPELVALLRDYRRVLAAGTARVAGHDVVDEVPVYWITVRRELLPDAADGKDHAFAHEVAVSRETYEPVALRTTRDGKPGPMTGERVLSLETLPAGEGDFTADPRNNLDGVAYTEGREPLRRDEAARVLGRKPLWLGDAHAGLPLAQVYEHVRARGRSEQTKLTGAEAERVLACVRAREPRSASRDDRTCDDTLRRIGSFAVRGDEVFTFGRVEWGPEERGVVLFYGQLGDDPSTYREDSIQLVDRPHVEVTLSASSYLGRGLPRGYVVSAGAVLLQPGNVGAVRAGGLYVSIRASSEELVLSAARALETMPAR
jgi:hypothetical protein